MTESGTGITALMVPLGALATHAAEYGRGGFRVVSDVTARNAIASYLRSSKMWVLTESDGKVFELGAGLTNSDWAEKTFSGGTPSPGSVDTAELATGGVTNAKLADMTAGTLKGRALGGGTGAPQDLTPTEATAILDPMVGDSGSGGTKGLVPAPAAGDRASGKVLQAGATWGYSIAPGSADTFMLAVRDITSIAGGRDVCYCSSTSELWIALGTNNSVRYYNLRTFVTGTVATTGSANQLIYCALNDRVYVSCGDNNVRAINPSTKTVAATIATAATPRGLTFDAVSSLIYVCAGTGVTEINPVTNMISRTSAAISGVSANMGWPVVANGSIYAGKDGTGGVAVISRSALTLTTTLGAAVHDTNSGAAYDGVKVWIGGTASVTSMRVVDPVANTISATITTTSNPCGIVYDSFSQKIYANALTEIYTYSPTTLTCLQVQFGTSGGFGICIDRNLGCLVTVHLTSATLKLFTLAY